MANIFPSTITPNFINFSLPTLNKSKEKFNTTDFNQRIYEQNFLGYQLTLDFNNLNFAQKTLLKEFYINQKGMIFQFPLTYFDSRFPLTINSRLKLIKFWNFNSFQVKPKILNDFRSTFDISLVVIGCRG